MAGWPFGGRTLADISTSFVAISTSSVEASTVAPFGRDRLSSAMPRVAQPALRIRDGLALVVAFLDPLVPGRLQRLVLRGNRLVLGPSFMKRAMAAEFAL